MNRGEIRQLRRRVDEAGSFQDRKRALRSAVGLLEKEIQTLEEQKGARRMLFHRSIEAWLSTRLPQNQSPFTIPEDSRAARMYRLSAFACIFLEAVLAAWVFLRLGLPWFSGALIALLGTLILEGGFSLLFRQVERPKTSLGSIKRWLLWPSLMVFIVSFLVLMLARTVTGELALLLLPAFGISLWTTTLSLLFLGSALLAAAGVLDWSKRDSAEYGKLDKAQLNLNLQKDEFLDELAVLEGKTFECCDDVKGEESLNTFAKLPQALARSTAVIFIAALVPLMASCTSGNSQAVAASTPNSNSTKDIRQRDLDIYIDTTSSVRGEQARETLARLREAMPEIATSMNVVTIRVLHFSGDGWTPVLKGKVELPVLSIPAPPKEDTGELGSLKNIDDAVKERRDREASELEARAREEHHSKVVSALSSLSEEAFELNAMPAAKTCTDLNGVFRRIHESGGQKPRLVIVLTDGSETCSKQVEALPVPKNNISLAMVLLPGSDGGNRTSKEDPSRASSQFDSRRDTLLRAIPWAGISPYFVEDWVGILRDAEAKK